MGKTFAYIRVSSVDQNLSRQLDSVKPFVTDERDIFTDKVSGKDFNRPKYKALKACLREGDLVVITSIDRLGRNYKEILNEWREITKEIKCDIFVIDMPLIDTRQSTNTMGVLISDIVLQLLAFVAENERDNIRHRQAEGIAAAKSRGLKFGRPKIEKPANFDDVYKKWIDKDVTAVQAMKELNLKPNTFYRLAKDIKK